MASKGAVWIIAPSGTIRPGLYRCRLAKKAPFVPVSLSLVDGDRDPDGELMSDQIYVLTIDGEIKDWVTHPPLTGEEIDRAEYEHLARVRAHDTRYNTTLADARASIDPLTSPIPFS